MHKNYIYFLVYPSGNKNKITVIDLNTSCLLDKDDYSLVSDDEFDNEDDAIFRAKSIARNYKLTYVKFESRYN